MQTTVKGKIILILLSLAMLSAIVYFAIISIDRSGKTPVIISSFPEDAVITINDTSIKTGTTYLTPGTYQLKVTKGGYDTYSRTVILEKTKQTLAIILIPNSDEAFEYGKKNEAAYRKAQAQGEIAAAEAGKVFSERNPITKDLPYKTFFYSVGYRMDQTDPSGNSILIEIDAMEGYRQAAIYRIRQLGYDPTDFTINFRDYENPFAL